MTPSGRGTHRHAGHATTLCHMLDPAAYSAVFAQGLPYAAYVETAKPNEVANWRSFASRVALSPQQIALVRSFTRRMNVLVISGTWCGDCVQQVPVMAAIASANPAGAGPQAAGIDLRLIDRDEHAGFAAHFQICGGRRVPTAIFLNEDMEFVALMGDKTLAKYRRAAAAQLGPACPLPGAPVPADELAAVTAEWLDQFERVALLLRLSAKLRARHGD